MWNLKDWYRRTYLQNRNRAKTHLMVTQGREKWINWDIEIGVYMLLCSKEWLSQ